MIGLPAEIFLYGGMHILMGIGIAIGAAVAATIFVPMFYPLKLTSINTVSSLFAFIYRTNIGSNQVCLYKGEGVTRGRPKGDI